MDKLSQDFKNLKEEEVEGGGEQYLVPGEVLHSQGTVAHYKQYMVRMYYIAYRVYYTL